MVAEYNILNLIQLPKIIADMYNIYRVYIYKYIYVCYDFVEVIAFQHHIKAQGVSVYHFLCITVFVFLNRQL